MRIKSTQGPRRVPLLVLLALLSCAAAILTTPLAMSKYAATGVGRAQARLAAFEPLFAQVAGNTGAAGFTVRSTASGVKSTVNAPKFYVRNQSEVAVYARLIPCYVPNPYNTTGSQWLHNRNQAGEYYDSSSPAAGYKEIPAGGVAGAGKQQLSYTVYSSDDNAANRAAFTSGALPGGTDVTANGALLPPSQSGTGVLLSPFFNVYNSAPTAISDQTTTGSQSVDMSGYWRDYRVVFLLRVTQAD